MKNLSSQPTDYLFEVSQKEGTLLLSFERCLDRYLALKIRRREVRRLCRRLLKSAQFELSAASDASFSMPCAPDREAALSAALDNIYGRLDAIVRRPMTSHEVQEALGISARERIRWTKDCRLRTCGTFTTQRQQIVTLNLYAADYIQELHRLPETIEAWRTADEAAQRPEANSANFERT